MKIERLSRIAFGLALAAMLVAMVFSILRRTNIAELSGVVSYIFLVMGVVLSFIIEIRRKKSTRHR